MKHFLFSILVATFFLPLNAQEILIYYEGIVMYPYEPYAYEFQHFINHSVQGNPICKMQDSILCAFLDKKLESAERCSGDDECTDATYKPGAMIQLVYIKDKYCYYTINLSSGCDVNSSTLTIDGKSYIPDDELEMIFLEIVKFRMINKRCPKPAELKAIFNGAKTEAPFWPYI